MAYIPTIALVWVGPNWSRTLFIPAVVSLRLFSNGNTVPSILPEVNADQEQIEPFTTFGQMTHFFETRSNDNGWSNDFLDEVFDEIGKIVGCVEEYIEFSENELTFGTIPAGLAVVQWFTRGQM